MPPRISVRPRALGLHAVSQPTAPLCLSTAARCAAVGRASVTTAAPSALHVRPPPPVLRYPPAQPPSHKPPQVRKTQLHRQYQSLLKSSPLMLIFQHNNVKAVELMSIRRELATALRKLDAERIRAGEPPMADDVRLQIVQTGIFASAMRVVEFFHPEQDGQAAAQHPADPNISHLTAEGEFKHGLSRRAYEIANNRRLKLELEPLLSGPLAVVAFPSVSPQYLKVVLSILSPSAPDFPAPKRKASPDYYEPSVQLGLQKLMLLGARVEGKVFDVAGTKWVGGINGGIDGLRAQVVHMLQGIGGSLTNALEGASRSMYLTLEGRRMDMEDKEKPAEEKKE